MLEINSQAPNFELLDEGSNKRRLSEFKGSFVVVYFYPKDDTPGCTTEACAIRDSYSEFAKSGIVVLGISADSQESHQAFKEKYGLPFILLSNPEQNIIKDYGAFALPMNKRITYIIDPKGMVAKVYPNVEPASHAKQILEDVNLMK